MKKYSLLIVLSVIISFVFVSLYASGSTTISTNINTGGTLTVEGVSLFSGSLQASTTALFTSGAKMYDTLVLYGATSAGTATEGGLYYDTSAKVIKLYDGSAWYTVGTSTDGFNLGGTGDRRIQMSDLQDYMTIGTTSQSGLSVLTVEATSTAAIPLTVRGYTSQTANLFQVHNVGGTELFAIDASGNASSTLMSFSGNVYVGDAIGDILTVTAGTVAMASKATTTVQNDTENSWSIATSSSITPTLSVDTSNGPSGRVGIGVASPLATLEVVGTASSTNLIVGGDGTNGNIGGIVFGTCSLARTTITASSTLAVNCSSATGITTSHRVFVMATSTLNSGFIIQAASSSAASTINLAIYNAGDIGTTSTSIGATTLINFFGIK